jgi:RNA polymerase sigma-70 factor (ECF subfamily)
LVKSLTSKKDNVILFLLLLDTPSITEILRTRGPAGLIDCVPEIYFELRRQAARFMRRERADGVLQTTALVHETYLRLVADSARSWQNRAHFMAICAHLMRQILIDCARRRHAGSRGGGTVQIPIEEAMVVAAQDGTTVDIQALIEALDRLRSFHERQAKVVELRYFGGLNYEEIAEVLGVSSKTAKRDWSVARAWLYGQLAS